MEEKEEGCRMWISRAYGCCVRDVEAWLEPVRALSVARNKREDGGYIAVFRNYPAASYAKRKGQQKPLNGRYVRIAINTHAIETHKRRSRSASRERRQEAVNEQKKKGREEDRNKQEAVKEQKKKGREEDRNKLEAERMKMREEVRKEIVEEEWEEIDQRIAERLQSEQVKLQEELEENTEQLEQLQAQQEEKQTEAEENGKQQTETEEKKKQQTEAEEKEKPQTKTGEKEKQQTETEEEEEQQEETMEMEKQQTAQEEEEEQQAETMEMEKQQTVQEEKKQLAGDEEATVPKRKKRTKKCKKTAKKDNDEKSKQSECEIVTPFFRNVPGGPSCSTEQYVELKTVNFAECGVDIYGRAIRKETTIVYKQIVVDDA